MDNRVRDELALTSELYPLNSRRSTFRTYCSGWDHDVLAPNAPDSHQFTIRDLAIKLLDSGRRGLAQFSSTPQDMNHASGTGSAEIVGEGDLGVSDLSPVSLSRKLKV